jgi:hypothetical protein
MPDDEMPDHAPALEIPDSLAEVPPVIEFGGAIGRRASIECKQGQHDLCDDEDCMCRHHHRYPGD